MRVQEIEKKITYPEDIRGISSNVPRWGCYCDGSQVVDNFHFYGSQVVDKFDNFDDFLAFLNNSQEITSNKKYRSIDDDWVVSMNAQNQDF